MVRREQLRTDVAEDRKWLSILLGQLEARQATWESQVNPKLSALRSVLESLPPTNQHGVPTKVVIFTNYKDTADYLFRGLGGPPGVECGHTAGGAILRTGAGFRS